MARHSLASYRQHKNIPAAHTIGSIMLITIYDSSLLSPRTVAPTIKVTLSVVLGEDQNRYLLQCRCTEVQLKHYRTTCRWQLANANSSFIHEHILVLNLHSMCAAHMAHLVKTQLKSLVICTAGNMLAVTVIGNMYCRKYVSSQSYR